MHMVQIHTVPYPPFGLTAAGWEAILARAKQLPLTRLRRVCERCGIRFDEPQSAKQILLVLDEAPNLEQLLECIKLEELEEAMNR